MGQYQAKGCQFGGAGAEGFAQTIELPVPIAIDMTDTD